MKISFLTLLAVFFIVSSGLAQKPKPAEDDDVVKISTNLIQIDVTVTGKDGKIISDLKPEDFEVFENGQRQDISNFSFISSGITTIQKNEKRESKTDIILPTKVRPENVRRTIALVVDDLTLSWESTNYVRRALRKFVETQMEDGDLVAIIRTGAGIGALQQFTNDKRMLFAAIEKIQWNSRGTGGIGAFAPIESNPGSETAEGEEESDEDINNAEAELNAFRESLFATGTLGAINYIVRGMKELPGRKSIMLLSDGFAISSQKVGGFGDSSRVLDALRQLVDLANRSSVVVYTLDARGLVYTGLIAADSVSSLSGSQIESQISERRDKLFNTQEGLVYLAKQTGGLPIINSNDISGGIRKVLDDQSYYLIGYQPDAETFDPVKRRFNRLEIKVKRKGANVRYRSGFFGVTDENVVRPTNLTASQKLFQALSSPFAVNDINLSLNTLFRADDQSNASISSFVYINLKDLNFVDTPEGKKASFDIVAVSFGDNGNAVDELSKSYTLNVKQESFAGFLNENFVYFFTFPVKKVGAYQMRIAVRDHNSEKLGSASQFIEVPKLSKKRMTLSGVVLENLTIKQWKDEGETGQKSATDPMSDTALRTFKRGSVLRFGLEVYNSKMGSDLKPQLQIYTRIFRDGKMIHEGKPTPVDLSEQKNMSVINAVGALQLGEKMVAGDYVLQVVLVDVLAKTKYKNATQMVQFEVVE